MHTYRRHTRSRGFTTRRFIDVDSQINERIPALQSQNDVFLLFYAVSSPIEGAAEVSKSIPVFVSSDSESGFFRILKMAAATKRSPPPSERAVIAPIPSLFSLDSSDGVVPPPSLSPLIGSSLSSSAGGSVSKERASFKQEKTAEVR